MALRYWVSGGTTDWNSTTNWSTSSGGASGASVPTTTDDAVFDASSGAGNATINVATALVISINFTNFTGTLVVNNILSAVSVTLGTGMLFNTTTGTPILRLGGTGTYTSNGVTWPYTVDTGTAAQTITFNGNATVQNFQRRQNTTAVLTLNSDTLTILGNLSTAGTGTANTVGSTSIVLAGTGTWSHASVGPWRNNLTINTAGTITVSGNVYYNTGTLTYTAGTVVTTGSTLIVAVATTLATNGITWNNIQLTGVITLSNDLTSDTYTITGTTSFVLGGNSIITTSSNLVIIGTTTFTVPTNLTFVNATIGTTTLAVVINTNQITISGNLTTGTSGVISGTTTLVLGGTGTWSNSSTGAIRNNLTINTAGTITVSGIVRYNTGVLTYTAGTVYTTGSTLNIALSTTLNTSGMTWDNVNPNTATLTLTLTSALSATTLTINSSTTFATNGFNVGTLIAAVIGLTIQLPSTLTSTITTAFTCLAATNASRVLFRSTTPGSKALLNLNVGATQDLGFVNATDINSLGGKKIYTYRGVITNTDNWELLPTEPVGGEASFTFVN